MQLTGSLKLGIAGLAISVRYRFPEFREFCSKYLLPDNSSAVFEVCATDEQIAEEMKEGTQNEREAEFLCIYRAIAENLPFYNRFVMHGAAISFEDKAYIFTAASGTGKSTHIKLWRKALGKNVGIVNGDKPVIEIRDDGTCLVFGTPWAGKERWERNVGFVLGGVCVLHRGAENSVERISAAEALVPIMHQVYLPRKAPSAQAQLELTDRFLKLAPFYSLHCDMSDDAVKCSFEALTGKNFEDNKRKEDI